VDLKSFAGYSTDPAILTQVRVILSKTVDAGGTDATPDNLQPSLDFLFLDADHSYAGVKFDYLHYGPLVRRGGLIALHDILDRPTSQVARLWREIVQSGARTRELVESPDQPEMGIGVVFL
jgi:predicted O-methyltransferase YrrM